MAAAELVQDPIEEELRLPIDFGKQHFADHKFAYYRWLREEAPVHRGKVSVLKVYCVSRYEDCVNLLKDPRFVRNRSTATGGSRLPFPMPKRIQVLAQSMIVEDDPEHRRMRSLVNKGFTPGAIAKLEPRVEELTRELLDGMEGRDRIELRADYATPIPMRVISEMMGLAPDDAPHFSKSVRALSEGINGWRVARTMLVDMPKALRFIRDVIDRKRNHPGDDILTTLIEAEEDGDRLSEEELVSLAFLLIIAGYETTLHLITNSVLTLLQHPTQLARLRAEPELWDDAVEELVRHSGPIHGTKGHYAVEDVTLHGVTIPKGAMVFPVLGAANRDPSVFANPEEFDITRSPNHHLGFGHGSHFCLGSQLARMETRISLQRLFERFPDLHLAVPEAQLKRQAMPLWHRLDSLPVGLR